MPSPLDDMLAQYLADVGDVAVVPREDDSIRLARESLNQPTVTAVLQCALRDGPELDDDLRRAGNELRLQGLDDVLAWTCFISPAQGVALACEIARAMLHCGELNTKNDAARERTTQLRDAVSSIEAREPLTARRCRMVGLSTRRRANSYRDQQVVDAAARLLGLADEDDTLFTRVTDAAAFARHAVDVCPQWATRYVPAALSRAPVVVFEPIEAWRAAHAFRGPFRDDIHLLVTQLSAGATNLRRHLFECPVSRERLSRAWGEEVHLDVLIPLAAAATNVTEALHALVPDAPPPALVDALAKLEHARKRFDRASAARDVGYLLGPDEELAARFRERVGTLDLYGALVALTSA
jgi:hypothetical protein